MAVTLPSQCPVTICKYSSNVADLVFNSAGGVGELSQWCFQSPKGYSRGVCFYTIDTLLLTLLEHCLILIQ